MDNTVKYHLNNMCPQKLFRVREVKEPWITNEILEEIKDKDLALHLAKRSNKAEDWLNAKADRNRVGRLVDQAKADFLKDQQQVLADDPKKFWRVVKSIVPGKKSKTSKIVLNRDSDDGPEKIEVREEDTADYINKFFSGIGPKLAANYNRPWRFYGDRVNASCPLLKTDFDQVLKLCKNINTTKSSGFSDVSSKIYKDAFMVLIPQLVQATIIPLYKGGIKLEVSNYRPILLLPLPGKLIERVAHQKITSFLEQHEVLSDKQGGFRKGFSTASSMVELTSALFKNINKGLTSLAAFIDLRKAFDTVNHGILKKKLACYGVNGDNLKWCSHYLTNRSQSTLANGVKSLNVDITCGVPQGSVLGPLFFILYVNDVQHAVHNASLQLYADDTVIHVSGTGAGIACSKLQPALDEYSNWCNENKLSLNASKTKLMVFGTRHKVKKACNISINMNNTNLQIVPTYKYLGFMLDSLLSFNCHVKHVSNMVNFKSNLLAKLRRYMTEETALTIYKSMILPYFDYADIIYTAANQEGLDRLQRLQNKCLKICMSYNIRYDTKLLHAETKTAMLRNRREAHTNNFMFGKLADTSWTDKRDIRTRAHDAPLFQVQIPKVEAYKRSIKYHGAVTWNNLSVATRSIKDPKVFKTFQKTTM